MTTYIHWKNVAFKSFFFHKLISTLFYNNIHSEDGNLSLLTLLIWLLIFSQFYFLFPKTLLLSWNYCLKSCQISIIKVVPLNPTSLYDALSLPPEMKKSFKQKCVHNDYKLREINTYLPNNYILFIVDFRKQEGNLRKPYLASHR